MSERQNIAWKSSWHDNYLKWVCGFANAKISRRELAQTLGINESAVQKHTDALKKKNMIGREGETKGQWKIIERKGT